MKPTEKDVLGTYMLCLLIKLDERIILTDSQTGTQVTITPYLRTKSGTPELQFAFDAPKVIGIERQKIRVGGPADEG